MQTVNSAVRWWARTTPDRIALSIGGEKLSYGEFQAWSDRVAAHLVALGVKPGDRVGGCAVNSLEYCALVLAVLRVGAILVPINLRYTPHEFQERVEDCAPAMVFADADLAVKFAGLGAPLKHMADLAAFRHGAPAAALDITLDPEAPIVILSTSGSTAKPKGVLHSHRTMLAYAVSCALEEPGFGRGARILGAAPMSTASGFVKLIQYTAVGATLYCEPEFKPDLFLDILVKEKITTLGGVPIFYERIAGAAGFDAADLSNLTTATTGGDRVPRPLQDRWAEKGVVIRQMYGQTECVGICTLASAATAAAHPEKCGDGGIFSELKIVDETGAQCPPHQPGEILVRSPLNMVGYWNNPEATAAALRDGWLHTGDVGKLDEEGELTFVARMKDIIISGGLNIAAAEVEQAISAFDGVEEVAVFGVADQRFGETPMAVVHASRSIAVGELVAHCNTLLADYKVPRYLVLEPEPLPRLATGKLAKAALREKFRDAPQTLAKVR